MEGIDPERGKRWVGGDRSREEEEEESWGFSLSCEREMDLAARARISPVVDSRLRSPEVAAGSEGWSARVQFERERGGHDGLGEIGRAHV